MTFLITLLLYILWVQGLSEVSSLGETIGPGVTYIILTLYLFCIERIETDKIGGRPDIIRKIGSKIQSDKERNRLCF